ncbi:MAG: glycosyltransferase family 1 protein [candidate division WOR-3 bacterium]
MKVLFNAAYDTRSKVGITGFIKCLVPPLSRLCDLTVLTPDPELFADHCATIRIPNWVRTHPGRVLWTLTCLPRYCTRDYDLVLCATPAAPIGVRIPVIAVVHDLTPLIMSQYHPLKHKVIFWVGIQSLRWADMVVTVSENTKRDLIMRFPKVINPSRIQVIYEAPCITPTGDVPEFAQQFAPYILYVGGHSPHKNVPRLLAAFAQLQAPKNYKLILVGWGKQSLFAIARNIAAKHGITGKIVILTDLADNKLSGLYSKCEAFVYPSLYEGFGLPVLEALAHGAPVACSSTSSLPEVADDAAIYFNPRSVESITRALELILNDNSATENLRKRALRQANRFSWAATAQKFYACAEALTSGKSGHYEKCR